MSGAAGTPRRRRPRSERAPAPLERDTHIALVELLVQSLNPEWRYTHIPSGELRDKATAATLKRMGLMPGWPDFIFVGQGRVGGDARVFFLELKRRGETRSDIQVEVSSHLMRSGCAYLCTDDLRDAIGMLHDLGIVRATVSA